MDAVLSDLRYAIRRLSRTPGFALVAVLSLALGIGANTAIFSLVDEVLLRELPQERPEELVDLYIAGPDFEYGSLSHPDYVDIRERAGDVFTDVGALRLTLAQLDGEDGVEMVPTELVSGSWFPLQGIGAAVGRTILPEDDVTPGGHPVAMLGYDRWRRIHGADPAVVGREIRISGRPYTVVGVADRRYTGTIRGLSPEIIAPVSMINEINQSGDDELTARGNQSSFGRARLAPGATTAEARAALERVAERLRVEYPDQWSEARSFNLLPTEDVVVHPMMDHVLVPAFGLLLAVVGVVLLIACANLASFLLARATDQRKEIAVRLAMGASRGALVRRLLTETVLLAVVGGGVGLVLATRALQAILAADLPLPLPLTLDVSPDGAVLAFTAGVSLMAGILFGLAPALQATDPDIAATLKDEGTGGGRPRRLDLRNLLVSGQMALSLTLLVAAGLLLRSLMARQSVDPGFGEDPAALVAFKPPLDGYGDVERVRAWWRTVEARLSGMPGVEAVGFTSNIHLNTLGRSTTDVRVDGVDPPPGQRSHDVDQARVDAGFFTAAGIELVAGRTFDTSDERGGPPVVVVNRAFAERFWVGEDVDDVVGRTFRVGAREATVVGVAETVKIENLGEPPTPFVYRAMSQDPDPYAMAVVRTSDDARRTLTDAVRAVRELEPRVMIYEATTLDRHLAIMLLPHRLSAMAAGAFAGLAMALAAVGLFGVVSYAVASRRREVGIRMSLGADDGAVVRLLMSGGMKVVGAGAAGGLVLSILFAQLLGRFLFGVPALDPLTFVVVPSALLIVAAVAAWVPALRATRVPPSEALKNG